MGRRLGGTGYPPGLGDVNHDSKGEGQIDLYQ